MLLPKGNYLIGASANRAIFTKIASNIRNSFQVLHDVKLESIDYKGKEYFEFEIKQVNS